MGAPDAWDVVGVGGNAALCAALAAREHGARVLVLGRARLRWLRGEPRVADALLGTGLGAGRVRGTRHNTGDGLRMALEVGAQPYGHWSGCHAVASDAPAATWQGACKSRLTLASRPG